MVAMLGASMPAPLAMPATVKVGCSTSTSLRPESVVRMPGAASAAASAEPDRAATSRGMPDSIGSIGSGMPMSPVEQTRTCSAATPRPGGRQRAHPLGVGPAPVPGGGVGVPAGHHHGRRPAAVAARWSRLTWTGAAAARFEVKVAAVGTGRAVVGGQQGQVEGAGGLDARGQPGGHEPLRGGDAHGYTPTRGSPADLGQPEGQVGALDGLAGGPLDQVVDGPQDHHPPGAGVDPGGQVGGVGAAGRLGRRRGSATTTKGSSS